MNKNQNQDLVKANLKSVYSALNELVNNWDSDTQELFEKFGSWALPSLDDAMADFAQFLEFLESQA